MTPGGRCGGAASRGCSPRPTISRRLPNWSARVRCRDESGWCCSAARLAREAVLQQSALSSNDASCGLAKQAALSEAVLAVHDRAQALVNEGRPATIIESTDFTPLLRAAGEVGPEDAAGIVSRRDQTLAALAGPAGAP